MVIDIVFVILLALAIVRGISRGFIVAIFSFIAIIIGVAAAMKLSFIVTGWLQEFFHEGRQWLPILSFLIVFICVVLLIRWLANLIQAAINIVLLGWLNKLGGVVLYMLIYLFVYSILLFYLTKMGFIASETISASRTYAFVEPFGEKAIEILGKIIPFFKDIFQQLSEFFEKIATHNA